MSSRQAGGLGATLLREWQAASAALSEETLAALRDLDVSDDAMARAGILRETRVSTTGRLWTPWPGGEAMVVQGVWSTTSWPSLALADPPPFLLDVLTWRLETPSEWFYRLALPGVALGGDQLRHAYDTAEPIRLHRLPLEWLQAGCEGAVDLERVEPLERPDMPLGLEPRRAAA